MPTFSLGEPVVQRFHKHKPVKSTELPDSSVLPLLLPTPGDSWETAFRYSIMVIKSVTLKDKNYFDITPQKVNNFLVLWTIEFSTDVLTLSDS